MTSTPNSNVEELPSTSIIRQSSELEVQEDDDRFPRSPAISSQPSNNSPPVAHDVIGNSIGAQTPSSPAFPIRITSDESAQATSFHDTTTASNQLDGENIKSSGTLLPKRFLQLRYTIVSCFATIPLSIVLFVYVYESLVSKNPTLGPLLFSPSRTLLVITILSQGLGLLIMLLFSLVFEALRWQLISRRKGIGSTTFLGLSSATPMLGIIRLLFGGGLSSHIIWCAQR